MPGSIEAKAGVEQIIRRQNVAMADDLARLWYRVAGQAVARTLQGDSRRAVMEDAVRALADKGLETVDYASHRRCAVDAATRRHMVTQASQTRARLLVQRCDEHEVPLVFTSAHYGARPSHAAWQGKPFGLHGPCEVGGVRYRGLAEATGYGEVAGLCGANCRHTFHPYSPGNTRLLDTRFRAEEAAFGQISDERYDALQRQRELERRVRRYKRRVAMGQEAGLDMAPDRAKLGRAQAEVRAWCRANRLPRRYDLERAYGVAEQPRALGGLAAAQPLVPKGPGGPLGVNAKVVNSAGYERRIHSLPIPKRAADGVRREAGRVLADCDGTQRERMAAVEWSTGRTVADSFGREAKDGRASLTAGQAAACAGAKGGVVLVHNHPASGRPSFPDIEAVAANGFVRGSVVACHDGTMYYLQSDHGSLRKIYNQLRDGIKSARPGLTGDEVDIEALDALYKANEEERWFRVKKQ